jgi:hypothetical protein
MGGSGKREVSEEDSVIVSSQSDFSEDAQHAICNAFITVSIT